MSGIVGRFEEIFSNELRLGDDAEKRRAIAFLFLVARTVFDLNDDETLDGIVDGGGDYGIDALYFEPPDQGEIRIALVRGKYQSQFDGDATFPENAIVKMIDAIGTLFDPDKSVLGNERLRRRIEDIRSFVADGAIPRVTAVATHNGSRWTPQAQERIEHPASTFGSRVDWRFVDSDDLFAMLQVQKPVDANVQLVGLASVEDFDFRRVLTGRMSVSELARLTNEYGNQLFTRNIRRYPGPAGNRVDEAVANTLRDVDLRPNFYFINNGITIICSQFRHNALLKENWQVQVNNLQIVNGGQTARTVQEVADEIGPDIATAEILVRLYELSQDDDVLIEAISIATNGRIPVDLQNLKANDLRQKILGKSISALGYIYRARREEKPLAPNEFSSAVVAEAFLAIWRKRPHQARLFRRQHFGTLYDTIFTTNLNGVQAVVAALLHRQAENHRKRPPGDAPEFLAYGSRFIAMLMGQYLLDDMGITLENLDRRNFEQALALLEQNSADYLSRAEQKISDALNSLFIGRERTLQRLSATFRRADLVELLA